jgi:hypothetical protein
MRAVPVAPGRSGPGRRPEDDVSTTNTLPDQANMGQLRAQAKELRRAATGGNPSALARFRAVLPDAGTDVSLRDAQLVIAREYGLTSWRDLAAAVVETQSGGRDLNRWFGVELNNEVWDLIDNGLSEDSPLAEREQALYAAYASAYHWRQCGTVGNHGRAEHLVASAAVAVGLIDVAARHARRYAEMIAEHPAVFEDWDRAFAAEALARVASRAGDADAPRLRAEARQAADAVADEQDRDIVLARLAVAPW